MQKNRNAPEKISGRITKVYFAGPDFSAGRILTTEKEEVQFAGNLCVKENQPVVLNGTWTSHPKYGRQFKVLAMEHNLELDKEGLIHYMANHPAIKGIGPVKAKRIVDKFGDDFEKTLIDQPELIAKAGQLSDESVQLLRDEWMKNRSLNSVLAWLSGFGLTHHQVTTLVDNLGEDCIDILKADPYILIREIRGFGFRKVDLIARKLGTPKDHKPRIRAGIQYCVQEMLDQGHCWVEYMELIDKANMLLVMDTLDSRVQIEKELDALIDEKLLSCETHGSRFVIAIPWVLEMEHDLATRFGKAYDPNPHSLDIHDNQTLLSTLNKKQREAVELALTHSISLISGGAGSGKSFTVSRINAICKEARLNVVLAAPTGKAAKRLEEMSGKPGTTIHRLLGYDGTSFSRNRMDPIDADVLIIDEFSMVDVKLAWHLFDAVNFSRTSVLIVGDHNQLPPVGPGNILRDLFKTRAIPTVILDKVVRQAGALKENCTAILNGEVRKTDSKETDKCRDWYLIDQFPAVENARKFLLDLFEKHLTELGFDPLKDVQLLTPTHKGMLGTQALNIDIQRLTQKRHWGVDVPPVAQGRKPAFFRHDKVIQTRNNYDLDVMNGTIGYVIDVRQNGTLVIDFDGTEVEIEKGSDNLRDLQLAYVITFHKAQGSEYPCAIVLIHKAHSFMHHRNLLYTGVTRAKLTAMVVGDHWGIKNCVKLRQVDSRKTFLSYMLGNGKRFNEAKMAGVV